MNIQGLTTNLEQLELFVQENTPKIICLSETHLTNDIKDCEVAIDGYRMFRCDSTSRHTGGVLVYIKKGRIKNAKVISNESVEMKYWLLTICISKSNEKVSLTTIYRSPNSSIIDFLIFFDKWYDERMDIVQ